MIKPSSHKPKLFLVGGIKGLQAYSTQVVTNALFMQLNNMGWQCVLLVYKPHWAPSSTALRLMYEAAHRYIIYPLWCRKQIPSNALVYITDHANAGITNWLKRPTKSIVHVHDMTSLRPPWDFPYKLRLRNFLIWLASLVTKRPGIKSANRLIAISDFTSQEIKKYLNVEDNKITVAYNGIDHGNYYPVDKIVARKELNLPKDSFIVVTVGPASLRKNYKTIANSLISLPVAHQKVTWLHIGDITSDAKIIITKHPLITFIRIAGASDDKMRLLYNSASAFISASLYEGFGLPPLEALACGTPVIVSDIAAHREILSDKALFYDPNDHSTLTNILNNIINSPNNNDKKQLEYSEFAERYDWRSTAETINRVIYQLTSTPEKQNRTP